jgi:hypothetical protein
MGPWDFATRKVRDVPNIKLIGSIPGTSVRFTADYVKGYLNGWGFYGIYFHRPDYQYYNMYKDMKQFCNCTVIMDFVRATYSGQVDNNPPETPHFWYDLADYSIHFYGNKTKFMDMPPIDFKYNTRMVAELKKDDYNSLFQLLYIKNYDGVMFNGKIHDLPLILYYNHQTRNGRECQWEQKSQRPCIRPKDLVSELSELGGDIFAMPYPPPSYFSYHSTGFTVTIPSTTSFNDNPEAKAKRRRAFLRNILDNYNLPQLFIDDTFVEIPHGMSNYDIYKVRWTEEETLSLTVVNMKYEDHPLIVPMFPNEVIGVATEQGVVNVRITENGAILDLKDLHTTKWVGATLHLENSEELKFRLADKPYRLRIDTGIIVVNNTEGFPANDVCLGTPYTQQVTFNKDTPEQFWSHYTVRGPWKLEDWHYQMFCCLRTNYFYDRFNTPGTIKDLRLTEWVVHNMSTVLKHICEERSVFEIAYDKRGKPCEYCMRPRVIDARYNNSVYRGYIIIEFDKPIKVQGHYTFYTNNTYDNATHEVNGTHVRNNNELWIELKRYGCKQEVIVDMEDVRVSSWFWDDIHFTGPIDNLVYQMSSCLSPLEHYVEHRDKPVKTNDDDLVLYIIMAAVVVLLLVTFLMSNPSKEVQAAAGYRPMLFASSRKKRVLEE